MSNENNKRKYYFPNRDMLPGNPSIKASVIEAVAANPETDQGKAEERARKQARTIFKQDSLGYENSNVQSLFEPLKNPKYISTTNVGTLKGMSPVPPEDSKAKTESTVKFNELVTVLFIDPKGLSLPTPSLYPNEQQTKAKLEGLARDVADCLVRDVKSEADLTNIKEILDTMIKENPNRVKLSLKVAQRTGTDICTVQFNRSNIAFLDRYYYEYEPDKNVKISYLDYTVTLAIEKFTQKYTSFTEQMKRSLRDLYTSIMEYLKGYLKGGRKSRRSKQKRTKKSKKRKRRTSKRRTLKKR